jgi:glycosyltransferase involved in cell wall biosynthesis
MNLVHLTASTFFGGPERQMLGLARHLPVECHSVFLTFSEGGRCAEFLTEVRHQHFEGESLIHDTPHLRKAVRELTSQLREVQASVLCCHGYKANVLGRIAARRAGIPVVAVSRGWTGENWKVSFYELLDRINLRWMDQVVCVSEGQARRVRKAGVPGRRVTVIRNAIDPDRFSRPDSRYRRWLHQLFPRPCRRIVGAAGRLSPEKGFRVLVEAAHVISKDEDSLGFVLFGDGPLHDALQKQIREAGLDHMFVLAGRRQDLDQFLPFFDVLALPSFTEGLPNVVLEACAAGVPVVATAVGGTPEVLLDGCNGYLVPPGDASALARRLQDVLVCDAERIEMGERGREHVSRQFTFAAQARQYEQLFRSLLGLPPRLEQPDEAGEAASRPRLRIVTEEKRAA